MKIRLINYRKIKLTLVIEKRYVSKYPIISLGYDCHPAYVLRALNLRTLSFPFDWHLTPSSKGIDYVNQNIKDCFKFFLDNLYINERGKVVSRNYPYSEFLHYPDLISNRETKKMISRRCSRFLDYFDNKKCLFLFNISSESLQNSRDVSFFLESVKEFHKLTKGNHLLLIYIRYNESLNENRMNCELAKTELKKLKYTKVTNYIRYKSTHGIWGDENMYIELLQSFGTTIKMGFPKIYLLKKNGVKSLLASCKKKIITKFTG